MEWYDFFKSCDDLELIKKRVSRKDAHIYISHDGDELTTRETLLGAAICASNKVAVRWLLELGVDPNKPCLLYTTKGRRKVTYSRWSSPLSYACIQCVRGAAANDIVTILLHYGANKDAKNRHGETAYDIAKANGNHSLMDLLQ